MSNYRTQDEVRRFDLVKLFILALLIVILVILLLRGCQAEPVPPQISLTATAPAVAQSTPPQPTPTQSAPTQPAPTAVPPVAPRLTSPVAGATLSDSKVTLKGTGGPNSQVQILVGGKVVGEVQVGADGTWTLATDLGKPGSYDLSAQVVDASGKLLAASDKLLVTLTAPTPALATPAKPAITSPAAGAGLPSGEVTLAGTGAANDEIEVLDNGKVVGTVKVGTDGRWRLSYSPGSGEHELSVRVKANPSAVSGTLKVTVAAPAVLPPAGGMCIGPKGRIEGHTYIVGVCDTLTRIGQINGISLAALLAANPQIEDPNLIYLGQVLQLPH